MAGKAEIIILMLPDIPDAEEVLLGMASVAAGSDPRQCGSRSLPTILETWRHTCEAARDPFSQSGDPPDFAESPGKSSNKLALGRSSFLRGDFPCEIRLTPPSPAGWE